MGWKCDLQWVIINVCGFKYHIPLPEIECFKGWKYNQWKTLFPSENFKGHKLGIATSPCLLEKKQQGMEKIIVLIP